MTTGSHYRNLREYQRAARTVAARVWDEYRRATAAALAEFERAAAEGEDVETAWRAFTRVATPAYERARAACYREMAPARDAYQRAWYAIEAAANREEE